MKVEADSSVEIVVSTEEHTKQQDGPSKIQLERITLEPVPNVGLLGLDRGSWHCGGGMGGL